MEFIPREGVSFFFFSRRYITSRDARALERIFTSHITEKRLCLRTAALPWRLGREKKKKEFLIAVEADDRVWSSAETPEGNIVPKGSSVC